MTTFLLQFDILRRLSELRLVEMNEDKPFFFQHFDCGASRSVTNTNVVFMNGVCQGVAFVMVDIFDNEAASGVCADVYLITSRSKLFNDSPNAFLIMIRRIHGPLDILIIHGIEDQQACRAILYDTKYAHTIKDGGLDGTCLYNLGFKIGQIVTIVLFNGIG